MIRRLAAIGFGLLLASIGTAAVAAPSCDRTCLENIAAKYRAAYVKHDPSSLPIAKNVRFSENSVEMPFPDGSWDTVTQETGPALTYSDPKTGQVAINTTIMQRAVPGFLTIRLKVKNGKITEIEHMLSTKRNLSRPPTPIGDVHDYHHAPGIKDIVPASERLSRAKLIALGDGYFQTLQRNDGTIHTRFSPDATRRENGLLFKNIEQSFKTGFYFFNNRVRRVPVMVDEARQIVLFRGFIDHKGVLDTYKTTDGKEHKSIFQQPQTWDFLEMFKIRHNEIVAVEATFIQGQYNQHSPWSKALNPGVWIPAHAK